MDRLDNPIRTYAWGSRTVLAELQGRPVPSEQAEAELWMGTHPSAPSFVVREGVRRSLADVVRDDPRRTLGPRVLAASGPTIPFLLKILAVEAPLSLQVHPDAEQARNGFDAENARGVPLDAPNRNYRDDRHKPELICALTEFDALCGFRTANESAALFDWLGASSLRPFGEQLRRDANDAALRRVFSNLMNLPVDRQSSVVRDVGAACRARVGAADGMDGFLRSAHWALRLAERYPGDIGVVTSLMLNVVRLAPGEALYLPAGNLHAYLRGVGVEIMACSDNVLRGGLTPKHVDVAELLRIVRCTGGNVPVVRATEKTTSRGEWVYSTTAAEFELSRIAVRDECPVSFVVDGPEVLWVSDGVVLATAVGSSPDSSVRLQRGESVFLAAEDRHCVLTGNGVVFRAHVPG